MNSYISIDARWTTWSGTLVDHNLDPRDKGYQWARSWAILLPPHFTYDHKMKLNEEEKIKMSETTKSTKLSHRFLSFRFGMRGRESPSTIKLSRPASFAHCNPNKQALASSIPGPKNLELCLHPTRTMSPSHYGPQIPNPHLQPSLAQHRSLTSTYPWEEDARYMGESPSEFPPSPKTPCKLWQKI